MGRKLKHYAVYKGEKLLAVGTAKECAEQVGVAQDTIYWLSNPSVHKNNKGNRKVVYRLED